ncbi:MAG TPA: hypothetical protein DDW17_04280 [Deltaproteobacteria bacterium]|nr:hypothetical protein [Deltaproteobacteria bacterium]
MKIIFFSDTHLTRDNADRKQYVRRFIQDVCETVDTIVILGDLFEFYHGYNGYIYPWFEDIINDLKALTNKGKSVFFLEGNHEYHMGEFFESYTGVKTARNFSINIDGKKTFISHGDEIFRNYLVRWLRSPFMNRLMDYCSPVLLWNLAMFGSLFLSDREKHYNEKVKNRFREFALKKIGEGYDTVILGHSHMADMIEYESDKGKKLYVNTGDFIQYASYLEYTSEAGFVIKYYKKKVE